MTLTIEIPENVVREAESRGVKVDDVVAQALSLIGNVAANPADRRGAPPPGFLWLGTPTKTREEATADIWEIASRSTLDGLKSKDLIEEGRRY